MTTRKEIEYYYGNARNLTEREVTVIRRGGKLHPTRRWIVWRDAAGTVLVGRPGRRRSDATESFICRELT